MVTLEDSIKRYARGLGFDSVGIASAEPFSRDEQAAVQRVRQGLMDGLPWYTEERVRRANRPGVLLTGARSIVSLAMSYLTGEPRTKGSGPHGRVARYAWGDDYHDVMKARLRQFCDGLSQRAGRPVATRIFVDDGPMNDRAAAERAGIGWFGKNTNILNSTLSSWILLGNVVTDLELEPDPPLAKNCGECVRCIDDCPTGAIVAPFVIDNRRCISFLTIELRGSIPRELRPLVGNLIFGCDICQEVCPWNDGAPVAVEPRFAPRRGTSELYLHELILLGENEFRDRFKGTPVMRSRYGGFLRNVAVAIGNAGGEASLYPLARALRHSEPLVRGHAAWALGRIGSRGRLERFRRILEARLYSEQDEWVQEEIELAIGEMLGSWNPSPEALK